MKPLIKLIFLLKGNTKGGGKWSHVRLCTKAHYCQLHGELDVNCPRPILLWFGTWKWLYPRSQGEFEFAVEPGLVLSSAFLPSPPHRPAHLSQGWGHRWAWLAEDTVTVEPTMLPRMSFSQSWGLRSFLGHMNVLFAGFMCPRRVQFIPLLPEHFLQLE